MGWSVEIAELLKKWNTDLLKDDGIEDSVELPYLTGKWLGRPPANYIIKPTAEEGFRINRASSCHGNLS